MSPALSLFLPFLAARHSYLGLAEGGRGGWSRFAFAAGIIFLLYTGAASVFLSAAALGAEDLDDEVTKALATMDFYAASGRSRCRSRSGRARRHGGLISHDQSLVAGSGKRLFTGQVRHGLGRRPSAS